MRLIKPHSQDSLRMDSFAGVAFPLWNVFFLLFFSFKTLKTIENFNRQIQCLRADAANGSLA